ncbi:MAG: SMP-30/gluconolactonase/LRE family protein [Gemmatimonadetes bacterium]|nr:SMP-30/gluconolactonase/LRE family protein [Gemmatimonadota bacterium]
MRTVPGVGLALPLACLLLAAGCGREGESAQLTGARKVITLQGFQGPESVRYDPDQDRWFVSNIVGTGSGKDGLGYISRIDAGRLDGAERFIESGRNGVTLNAPKGMALQGDTLWVADIDVLRGFDRRTGSPLAAIDLSSAGAVLLNDVAIGPAGAVHVTDSGIEMTEIGVLYRGGDKILSVGPGGAVSVVARGPELGRPNGITWDPDERRWLVVSFDPFGSEVYAISPGNPARTVLARGKGHFDGVERLPDGGLLVTSWSDSSLHLFSEGRDRQLVRHIWQPADLGLGTRRQRVAIPLVLQGRVEIWDLPTH